MTETDIKKGPSALILSTKSNSRPGRSELHTNMDYSFGRTAPSHGSPVEKAERIVCLGLHLRRVSRLGQGMTRREISEIEGYSCMQTLEAFEKATDRDLRSLRKVGLTTGLSCYTQQYGYEYSFSVTRASAPTKPVGVLWERLLRILWEVERREKEGLPPPTLRYMAAFLKTYKPSEVMQDLEVFWVCCAGPEPHHYKTAEVVDGRILIGGPRMFS